MDFKELLTNAQAGNHEAIEALFEMYRPLLLKNSYVDGVFDEDLFQEQCLHFMSAIKNFKVDYDDPGS